MWLSLDKILRLTSACIVLLQHRNVGQKSLVVEVFGASRADLDARLALDADTGTGVRCIRRDRTHRTDGCTDAASGTFFQISNWFGFQEDSRFSVGAERCVIWSDRIIAAHGNRSRDFGQGSDLFSCFDAECMDLCEIICIWTSGCQLVAEYVLGRDTGTRNGVETVRL